MGRAEETARLVAGCRRAREKAEARGHRVGPWWPGPKEWWAACQRAGCGLRATVQARGWAAGGEASREECRGGEVGCWCLCAAREALATWAQVLVEPGATSDPPVASASAPVGTGVPATAAEPSDASVTGSTGKPTEWEGLV